MRDGRSILFVSSGRARYTLPGFAALLSDGMRWTNGERIEVSGGQSL